MKKIFLLGVVFALVAFNMFSCAGDTRSNPETTDPSQNTAPPETQQTKEYNFGDKTTIDTLKKTTFYAIFPVPEGSPRDIVINYMRKMATVEWVAGKTWTTSHAPGQTGVSLSNLKYTKGKTYYGLPYSNTGANLEYFEQFIESGKFTPESTYYTEMVGNHCSSSMDRAFEQVVDFPAFGYLKPASTSKRNELLMFPEGSGITAPPGVGDSWYSSDLLKHNGVDKMFEGYALLGKGDILYYHIDGSGHTRMVSGDPVVVRKANGKIDHKNSYLTVIEQTNAWFDKNQNSTWFVDKKYTFSELCSGLFMPVTLKIYHQDPPNIKDAYISFNGKNTPESILTSLNGTVKSNFTFVYLSLKITNSNGEIVKSLDMHQNINATSFNISPLYSSLAIRTLPAGEYTYSLSAGIARGSCEIENFKFTIS